MGCLIHASLFFNDVDDFLSLSCFVPQTVYYMSARIGSEHEIPTLILPRSRPPIQLKGSSKWISRIRGACSTSQAHARFAQAKNQDKSRLTEPGNTAATNVSVYASVGSV